MPREPVKCASWVDPAGGDVELLLLSSVLAQAYAANGRRWHVVRRAAYHDYFDGHPAVESMGSPPADAALTRCGPWLAEDSGPGDLRPYQRLGRLLGLPLPLEEKLYLPGDSPDDSLLHGLLPLGKTKVVAFCATGRLPAASLSTEAAVALVVALRKAGLAVVQVGASDDPYVAGAMSVLGLLSPRQTVALVRRCSAAVTVDGFLLHAARLAGVPAVALWGATSCGAFGYEDQANLANGSPAQVVDELARVMV